MADSGVNANHNVARASAWLGSHSLTKRRVFQVDHKVLDKASREKFEENQREKHGNLSGIVTYDVIDTDQYQIRHAIGIDKVINPKTADKIALVMFFTGIGFIITTYMILGKMLGISLQKDILGLSDIMFYNAVWVPFVSLILLSLLYVATNLNVHLLQQTIKQPMFVVLMMIYVCMVGIGQNLGCFVGGDDGDGGMCKGYQGKAGKWTKYVIIFSIAFTCAFLLGNIDALPTEPKLMLFVLTPFLIISTLDIPINMAESSDFPGKTSAKRALSAVTGGGYTNENSVGMSTSLFEKTRMVRRLGPGGESPLDDEEYDQKKCPKESDLENKYCGHDDCINICPKLWKVEDFSDECFMCECKRHTECNYQHYYRILGELAPIHIQQAAALIFWMIIVRAWVLTLHMKLTNQKYTYSLRPALNNVLIQDISVEDIKNTVGGDMTEVEKGGRQDSKEKSTGTPTSPPTSETGTP